MVLEKTEDSMDILRGIGVITAFFISIIVLGTRYHLGSWIEPFLGNIWLFVKIIGGIILLYLSISVVLQALKTKKKETME